MRELELFADFLQRERDRFLALEHTYALTENPNVGTVRAYALLAEKCGALRDSLKVLANDPGKFIKEYLQ